MSSPQLIIVKSGLKAKKRGRKPKTNLTTRVTWNTTDSTSLISVVKELGIMEKFDDKKTKKCSLYKRIKDYFSTLNPPIIRDPDQIERHWKFLRRRYIECKIIADKSGEAAVTWKLYQDMNDLMGDRPLAQAVENGVESVPADELEFSFGDQQLEGITKKLFSYQSCLKLSILNAGVESEINAALSLPNDETELESQVEIQSEAVGEINYVANATGKLIV